jgi:hypothetical protein
MTKKMVEPAYKYAVYPGWVRSKDDNNEHYIDFNQLCRLYHVDPEECVMVIEPPSSRRPEPEGYNDDLIKLRPRKDGNYDLP